ncbi:MAG: glycerol-3-phosphate dehydrogenase/oxidase [Pirellulales bacterium]
MAVPAQSPVLILGAGINGAAIARELTLNGVSVVVVDPQDIASGATAYSSRLAHGGLRYLEYGEFELVRESLEERNRWLRLAPHLTRPMRFVIPVASRFGGLWQAGTRFFGLPGWMRSKKPRPRGLWTVRLGLWFYDRFVGESTVPSRTLGEADRLPITPQYGRKQCEYGNAQLLYPERMTVSLFADAQRAAGETQAKFSLFTYHRAKLNGDAIEITEIALNEIVKSFRPSAIIDAAGSWVDEALKQLPVSDERRMAGTKGSHAITSHTGLRAAIGDRAVYAEAQDGRPIFIIPFRTRVLIGTTDLPFKGDPSTAVADEFELTYLTQIVQDLFPQLGFKREDIEQHYSGVRPLPYVGPATPAAVTRKHWHVEIPGVSVPCYAVIGGKLTTCRSLAEETVATILKRLGLPVRGSSRDRSLQGEFISPSGASIRIPNDLKSIRLDADVLDELERFYGNAVGEFLQKSHRENDEQIDGTRWPCSIVRWMIAHEWVERLEDLVERRMMLVFEPRLKRSTIAHLASILGKEKGWNDDAIDAATRSSVETLRRRYGKLVE